MTNRQVIEDFIEIYKSQPCLWMVQSKEYYDRRMKHAAYNKLVDKLKLIDPVANRDRVVKKINALRSNYRKELKKVAASERSAARVEDVYVPTLWYFDRLQFLNEQEKVRKTVNDVIDSDGETEMLQVKMEPGADCQTVPSPTSVGYSPADSHSSISRPATPKFDLHGRKTKNELANEALISLNEHFKRPREERQDDRFDIFGKNIAAKLRDIDNKTQRILAEKLINDALFEAEMGTLTPHHRLCTEKRLLSSRKQSGSYSDESSFEYMATSSSAENFQS